jgi:hypothetical protein
MTSVLPYSVSEPEQHWKRQDGEVIGPSWLNSKTASSIRRGRTESVRFGMIRLQLGHSLNQSAYCTIIIERFRLCQESRNEPWQAANR